MFTSIFVFLLLILTGQNKGESRYADIYNSNNKIVKDNNSGLQAVILPVSFFDEQDSSDFNDFSSCVLSSNPVIQPIVQKVESITFIPIFAYKLLLQFTLIDLPPPSLS